MMNKDTKDLLQMIKNTTKYIDARLTIDAGCCKCLLEYIDELNNKIDKAVEYVKDFQQIYDIDGSIEKQIDEFNILASPKKLLEILKGDVNE